MTILNTRKIFNDAVEQNFMTSDHFIIQKTFNEAIEHNSLISNFIPDHFKIQKFVKKLLKSSVI